MTSDSIPEVEIRPFSACAMHPAIIIGTVWSLWTWLWGRYHVPQNVFLVQGYICNNFFHEAPISFHRDMSQTVEKSPISRC